ncbi:hypothetical protein AB1Y20_012523 [Prymnesium parvum]|uniref:glucan 1,4-alpha-glucosidase n=1 Tax=Prymnesium parvum TaxID=97485 RepID=A0AB34IJ24_PRYPA
MLSFPLLALGVSPPSDGCATSLGHADGCATPPTPHAAAAAASCFTFPRLASPHPPFSSAELLSMSQHMLRNVGVGGTGAVVAADDHHTPGGSYYFHWARDGALTMISLQLRGVATDAQMRAYAAWEASLTARADPHAIDARTEPKFTLPHGEIYGGAWCRPQNDAPGLRAAALLLHAERLLLSPNASGGAAYVSAALWSGGGGGLVERSLAYITEGGWGEETCDLWEEVRSADFFWNRVTMKLALEMGADFDARHAAGRRAARLRADAARLGQTIASHFAGGFIFEGTHRKVDAAVIVGLNLGFDDPRPVFPPASDAVAATVLAYTRAFCAEYELNAADAAAGVPGVLFGRYPNDTYAGGNPWVLTTAALAQLLYRVSHAVRTGATLSAAARRDWAAALNAPLRRGGEAELLFGAADAVLARLHAHVAAEGGRLDEQIDRRTGRQMAARSLTWSYSELFNALHWRDLAEREASRA